MLLSCSTLMSHPPSIRCRYRRSYPHRCRPARLARRDASFLPMKAYTSPPKQLCPLTRAQLITFEGLLFLSGLFLGYLLLRLLCFRCHDRNSVVGLVRGPSIYTNN